MKKVFPQGEKTFRELSKLYHFKLYSLNNYGLFGF